jgi:hypothetical protein
MMSSDSSLSSAPDNLGSATETAVAVQPVVNSKKKKKKAGTTPRTKAIVDFVMTDNATAITQESPRPKRRAAKKAIVEETFEDEATAEVPVSIRPKRGAVRKAIVGEEIMEGEFDVEVSVREIDKSKHITDNKAVVDPTKRKKRKAEHDGNHEQKPKPAKKRARTVKNEEPVAERTKDIPHIIGAHVSTAGGKSSTCATYSSRRPKTNMDWTTIV